MKQLYNISGKFHFSLYSTVSHIGRYDFLGESFTFYNVMKLPSWGTHNYLLTPSFTGIICNSLSFWHAVYRALLIQSKLCTGHNQDIVSMDSSLSQSQSYRRRQDQRQLCSLVDILENRGEIHGTHVTVLDLSSRLSPPHSSLPPHSEQANTSHAAFTHLWHLSYISIHSTNGDMR